MRMTVPLPNWRSIWVRAPCRAASFAFAGSWMLMPSTLGRGADRRQHAFVTKARRVCAKCVERGSWDGLLVRQPEDGEAQRRVAEPAGPRGQPGGDAMPVETPRELPAPEV